MVAMPSGPDAPQRRPFHQSTCTLSASPVGLSLAMGTPVRVLPCDRYDPAAARRAPVRPTPPRLPGTKGRLRVSGARQPTLLKRLADPKTARQRATVTDWYGQGERQLYVVLGAALWYHPGKQVPVRWLLVRDPAGAFEPQRQWSDLAIARTTPCLLALFSLATLWASDLAARGLV